MKPRFSGISIKKFIVIWTGGLTVCFAIIALAFVISTHMLQDMNSRIFTDSMAIEAAYQLEAGILAERREELLWRATLDEAHRRQKENQIKKIIGIVRGLDQHSSSIEEAELIEKIKKSFDRYLMESMSSKPSAIEEISTLADSLLQDATEFREQERIYIAQTADHSRRLNSLVDKWTLWLIFLVAATVVLGSAILIHRIFQPVYNLSRAAEKFGGGDLGARTRVYRDDELGQLCRTFNRMADSIGDQQQERLHFIATLAHDLKNPLVVVGAAARRIKKTNFDPGERSVWMDCIIKQVTYMEHLISDLMDSVQIATGRLNLHMSRIELASLIRAIQQEQQDLIESHRIVFEGEGTYWVQGDPHRLQRVILNLISNAVKYSPDSTTVLLRVSSDESRAVIVVKDEGVGIPQEEMENLFLPFQRLSAAHGLAQGVGLGLFSVKKIVTGHGGTIKVISEPGSGTTIEITLPLMPEE